MDCNKALENLSALIDNEVSDKEREELLLHIAECEACREEYERLIDIKAQFKSLDRELRIAISKSAASPADKAMEEIYKEAYPRRAFPFLMRHIGTAAALILVVALFLLAKRVPPAEESLKFNGATMKDSVALESQSKAEAETSTLVDGALMDVITGNTYSEPMEAPNEITVETPVASPMEPSIEETADEEGDMHYDVIKNVSVLNFIPLESGVVIDREHEDFILLNFVNSASGKDFALVEAPIDEVLDELQKNYVDVIYSNHVENSERTLVCYDE